MIANHSSRRPLNRARQISVYTADDRDRRTQARQQAEALFAAKPATPKPSTDRSQQPPPQLPTPSPAAPEPEPSPSDPQLAAIIPPSEFTRIRTWLKYGMAVADAAAIYKVDTSEIKRIRRLKN